MSSVTYLESFDMARSRIIKGNLGIHMKPMPGILRNPEQIPTRTFPKDRNYYRTAELGR